MHTHQVAIPAWRGRNQSCGLGRTAAEADRGGTNHRPIEWRLRLDPGSGKAERVEGGYQIAARKVFTSRHPSGDLLMTGAGLEEEGAADGPAFRRADDVAARKNPRDLADAGNARHGVE